MTKATRKQEIIFYQLQPMDPEEKDFRLHVRADTEQGIKQLKRWFHINLHRRAYYYDRVAEYHTIKANGKYYLEALTRDPVFQMVQGIPRDW